MGAFKIVYRPAVAKDIVSIPTQVQWRIKVAIESKLASSPLLYGVPLHGNLKGFHKLRVGDYRIIFEVQGQTVKVHCIGMRKNVYDKVGTRVMKE